MLRFITLCLLLLSHGVLAEPLDGATGALVKEVSSLYTTGKYGKALVILKQLQASELDGDLVGLVSFWQAMCHKKLQQYNLAADAFKSAADKGYHSADFSYEYAQTLYAIERWPEAKQEFEKSYKGQFKPAVSLYYIATIEKTLGERNNAIANLQLVKTLDDKEAQSVVQPAEVLIGDLFYDDAVGKPHQRKLVEKIVIPQYEKALAEDPKSEIASLIQQKIRKLKQDNRLAIYELINGKPTIEPRYLLKITQEFSQDSNVTFSPAETTISKARQASSYSKTDVIGRYTFYYRNFFSFAPGVRANQTRYFNRVPEIYRNDNQLLSAMLNMGHEHSVGGKPASFLIDYDYTNIRRDVDSEERLKFSSRAHTLSVGESFRYFSFGDTTVRARHRSLESYQSQSDSNTNSLVIEQLAKIADHFMVLMASYDRTRVKDSVFDTDALLLRGDYYGPSWKGWVTPSVGFALTVTDPINDRDNRGTELLVNPSARLSHSPARGWRLSLKGDYQKNNSKDEENFAYSKFIYGLEIDYIF